MKPFADLEVEWDEQKAASNLRKHGVSFEEAKTVIDDPLSTIVRDPDHSVGERRYHVLGCSFGGKVLVVICVDRGGKIRIVSARVATPRERKDLCGRWNVLMKTICSLNM